MKLSTGILLKLVGVGLCYSIIQPCPVLAQGEPLVLGARAWGLGNATVADSDPSSPGANIAGIAAAEVTHILAAYDTHYNLPGIGVFAASAVVPLPSQFVTSVAVLRFGDEQYHDLQASIGLAHRIEKVSLGLRFNYLQQAFNIPSLILSRRSLVMDMGGQIMLGNRLRMGAHAYNLFQSSFSGEGGAKVPTILKIGLQYEPVPAVYLAAELYKHTNLPTVVRGGLSYKPLPFLIIRTGISAGPMTHHFGLGVQAQPFWFDYAVHSHNHLGWSHHLSIGYRLQRKETESGVAP
ncbi:hypothetical protein [Dyadobacter tibetensis]|uniref:hypothetical protein n=1 Tax=Dyadobacter tibetensis TaxID=1211851 RepID=UPI00047042F4|nr:hypothetical protein [Dyadobacter tibetensis]